MDETSSRKPAWHAVEGPEVVKRLETSLDTGLASREAADRLREHGPNTLQTDGRTPWPRVLLRQFVDVLILILVLAAAISMAIGEVTDALAILAIVVLNGLLGFAQEWKAERALQALRRMLSPRCTVLRDQVEQRIDASDLVPGDIVLLETGDCVPADLRLLESVNLRLDESILTGESASVAKGTSAVADDAPLAERGGIAWMGTAVTNGRARGVAVGTGPTTEFGRIAALTQSIEREITPLQKQLARLGRRLGYLALAVSALVLVAGVLSAKPPLDMFMTAISLAVAVVPEGLPAVVTITLALGIRAMARRRALLRRLVAAETLGSATVICTDKTGTLTENQMTVQQVWLPTGVVEATGVGYDPRGHFEADHHKIDVRDRPELLALLETGLACNHARLQHHGEQWSALGEPTEAALVTAAGKAWLEPPEHPQAVSEFSFNSDRKRMTVVQREAGGLVAHVKGAPEVILERCTHVQDATGSRAIHDRDRVAAEEATAAMASRGLRTLALARRDLDASEPLSADGVERDLTLLGVVGIIDPPRPEVPGAMAMARAAGIRVIMITGDASATALAIARRIGLPATRAVSGQDLDAMDEAQLAAVVGDRGVVFARTTPEHKLRLVGLLQAQGEVVGMTGDGVNDAPALKKADIGIAMGGRGTDVARGAADLVLTDDNFASIISAVEEGRRQFDNIQKFLRNLVSSNIGEVTAIFCNILLGGPLIFLPAHLLWINLATDGLTSLALGVEPVEADTMERPPRRQEAPMLDRADGWVILAQGVYIGLATLWLFNHVLQAGGPDALERARTVAFCGIVVGELINAWNYRALRSPLARVGWFSNPWLSGAWVASFALQLGAVYLPFMQVAFHTIPLGWADWGLIVAVTAPVFLVTETWKLWRWRGSTRSRRKSPAA
ncbi:MAG: HAD-IC family P-type ATPase [Phycisphaerae bacterium]|nr:HAD-IC family P-type ATPase [Phycisphaerae bacterium]